MAVIKKIVKKAEVRQKKVKLTCLTYNVRTLKEKEAIAKGVYVYDAWKHARGMDKIAKALGTV